MPVQKTINLFLYHYCQISKQEWNLLWKQHNLKPHLIKTFKVSRNKHFVEKL
jgi:hypothetical protein